MDGFSLALFILRLINFGFIISIIFIERKKPESAIGWILAIVFLPYVGIILYLLLGETFRFKAKRMDRNKILNDEEYKRNISMQLRYLSNNKDLAKEFPFLDLIILNVNNAGSLISSNNEIKIFTNATDKYESMFEDIANAKSSIHISYFIIRRDEIGRKLVDLLEQKAKEGVEVRLLYDKIGSRQTTGKFFNPITKAGGMVKDYFPTKIWFRPLLNHRNHRKMIIIDGTISYIGGMNIGKEYTGASKRLTPWRDTHLKIIGSSSNLIQIQFFLDYMFVSKEKIDFANEEIFNTYFPVIKDEGDKVIQIVASGPDYKEPNIRNSFIKMINNAKENIYIQTPYFIPDEAIYSALRIAAKSGVKIKLMIPGIPDKRSVYYASLSHLHQLLEDNIEVYYYNGFLHSKVIVCDENITTIGSANLDRRSFNLNFEINAIVYDKDFAKENIAIFNEDIKNSKKIDLQTHRKRNILQKAIEQICRLLAPLF